MATSYEVIRDVIIANRSAPPGGAMRAIKARLTNDPSDDPDTQHRKLFPLILGKNTAGAEYMVQCYQYAGYSKQELEDNYSKKNHRCFKVNDLKSTDTSDPAVQNIAFDPNPAFTIERLKYKEVKRQVCVDEDNVEFYYG